jgi:hypothetical protein
MSFHVIDNLLNKKNDISSSTVHVVGERDGEGCVSIPIMVKYYCNLSTEEINPVIGMHSSLRKPPRVGYTMFPVKWDKSKGKGSESVDHKVSVNVGTPFPWPRDSSLWFQVFAEVKSSEGAYRLEKTGSGCFSLYNLVGSTVGSGGSVFRVPLVLQSMRLASKAPVIKGVVEIKYLYGSSASPSGERVYFTKKEHFKEHTEWDITQGNIPNVEETTMRSVNKLMAPFVPKISELAKVPGGFAPISDELGKVHAPIMMTEAGAIPGDRYWANIPLEEDFDERVYLRLVEISLERNHMSRDEFVAIAGSLSDSTPTSKIAKISEVYVTACTVLANSIPYIADYADLNNNRFSRVPFSEQKSHITTESFDWPFTRRADDCEGVGKAVARVHTGFRDGKFSSHLLKVTQRVSKTFIVVGALGSVTARNLGEASGDGGSSPSEEEIDADSSVQGQPLIGSKEDQGSSFGAHMWTMFFSKRRFLRMCSITSASNPPKWTDGTKFTDYPEWQERVPVLLGEGTGQLSPLVVPPSVYEEGLSAKRESLERSIREREATVRVMTDTSIRDLIGGNKTHHVKIDEPGELAKIQMIQKQQAVMENRDRRVSPFYRRVSCLFPVMERHDEIDYSPEEAEPPLPSTWQSQVEAFFGGKGALSEYGEAMKGLKDPVYSWRSVVPVEISKRPSSWNPMEKEIMPGEYDAKSSPPLRWGANIEDILYKRSHVALVRMCSTSVKQEKAIGAIMRHLPPVEALTSLSEEQQRGVDLVTESMNRTLDDAMMRRLSLKPVYLSQDSEHFSKDESFVELRGGGGIPTKTISFYIKSQDISQSQVERISERVSKSPYAVGAKFTPEIAITLVGSYRLDVVVDITDSASLNDDPASGFRWITEKAL